MVISLMLAKIKMKVMTIEVDGENDADDGSCSSNISLCSYGGEEEQALLLYY